MKKSAKAKSENHLQAFPIIQIRGARVHNLQSLDVDIPTRQLVVITGVSGSGKSSLAVDVLFAEGQRRYLESVTVRTRTLLSHVQRPDVDYISGLPPTVAVDQRSSHVPRRSTLAITTEIYDYLRLLYARAGIAHCTQCGVPVSSQPVSSIVQQTLELPERTRLMILSPLIRSKRGAHKEVFERIIRNGFVRARVDGELIDMTEVPALSPAKVHSIEAVVDRIVLKEGIEQRLRESIDLACRESDGTCAVCYQEGEQWKERFYSTRYACAECQLNFQTPEPRSFSFQSPLGACKKCQGIGVQGVIEEAGEIPIFGVEPCTECHGTRLQAFPRRITFFDQSISMFTRLTVENAEQLCGDWIDRISSDVGADPEVSKSAALSSETRAVAARLVPEIRQRLRCLCDIGLGYLTLDRETRTLSGGEYQRARLAACLGTGLHGACFVLDEPTSGLHPRDTGRLIQTLRSLRDTGATVLVVEHDLDVMRSADWLIDIGPGAGRHGGKLMFCGPPDDYGVDYQTPTALALGATLASMTSDNQTTHKFQEQPATALIPAVSLASERHSDAPIVIREATLNNLQRITVEIPTRKLVTVTGVSGSGKSSLIVRTLLPAAKSLKDGEQAFRNLCRDVRCSEITGLEQFDRVASFEGRFTGKSSRSSLVTVSGLWTDIRRLYTKTREARARACGSSYFSFNSGEGRCPECRGSGVKSVQMGFLPSAEITCPACRGRRFTRAALSIRFNGRNVADVLEMTVTEAAQFFSEFHGLQTRLRKFEEVGLGYLTLGQSTSTMSGGELQRVHLASELLDSSHERVLFILDEPTAGLHPADTSMLIGVLRELVHRGHTVIVVEHNTTMIRCSDWNIDVGPDAGPAGGRIIFAGSPDQLGACSDSQTGKFLRPMHDQAIKAT